MFVGDGARRGRSAGRTTTKPAFALAHAVPKRRGPREKRDLHALNSLGQQPIAIERRVVHHRRDVLVVGAAGRLGGAVGRHLVERIIVVAVVVVACGARVAVRAGGARRLGRARARRAARCGARARGRARRGCTRAGRRRTQKQSERSDARLDVSASRLACAIAVVVASCGAQEHHRVWVRLPRPAGLARAITTTKRARQIPTTPVV